MNCHLSLPIMGIIMPKLGIVKVVHEALLTGGA